MQELQAKAQQAAESTIAGAAPTEVDMETCKLAFETEKQEAVRKAIETCNERSKVDQMQLQVSGGIVTIDPVLKWLTFP